MLTYLGVGGSKNGVLGHNQDFLDQDRMVTKSEEQLEQEQEIKQEKKAIYEIYWIIFIHKSNIEFACVRRLGQQLARVWTCFLYNLVPHITSYKK